MTLVQVTNIIMLTRRPVSVPLSLLLQPSLHCMIVQYIPMFLFQVTLLTSTKVIIHVWTAW